MRTWTLISIVMVVVTIGALAATGPEAQELAQRGYSAFKAAIAGDEARLPEAIEYMEKAGKADDGNVPNLFNLARAYFFEGITFDKEESISKSEKLFARIVELDSSRMDALSFHGAILAMMSRGNDMDMFMRGAKELRTAMQKAPDDIGVRIVAGFVSFNLPPEALPLIGNPDTLGNLRTIGIVLNSFSSDFAPHAGVVMNAFIGESLMMSGEKEKARERFAQALNVPKPDDPGQRAGRELLNRAISARMNGGERPIFAESVFGGCHSCHLAAPEKLLSK